ncbi:TPA: hypothetical protein EYG96_02905 [Candidatus Gracilibacteria bacterium]|nr:hypothetical protein [Candidatus Gracilibacteria bacterium]
MRDIEEIRTTGKPTKMYRFLEMIPALLSWSVLLIPMVLAFYVPKYVSYFMAIFVFLWFFRTIEYIIFLLYSYFKFKKIAKKDFSIKLQLWDEGSEKLSKKYKEIRKYLEEKNDIIHTSLIKHVILIATCGEEIQVLRDTIDSIKNSDFDMNRVVVVLAREERMEPESLVIASLLEQEYLDDFLGFYSFAHPANIPGEVIGKGGNITFSGKNICKILEEKGEDISKYLVTTLDADNRLDSEYLNVLTFHFAASVDRQKSSYQPIPLFFNNIWDVPMINRMIAISGGFWHMVESARPHRLHNFSSHAQPLLSLKAMNFWATHTIVEDGHQYWRSYFHFNGDYFVEPLFVPIYQDAVLHTSWKSTMVAQYKQIRRWAWGASDIPFVIDAWWEKRKELPFIETFLHFLRLMEAHIFWATGALVITLATPIPGILNPAFAENGYDDGVAQMLSFFFSITSVGILLSIILSVITLPRPQKSIKFLGRLWSPLWRYIAIVVQWFMVPIMTVGFGAFPALDAQTRLFLGKYLGFNVTKKVRVKKRVVC